jgi:prophage antirepressor-like protein
MTNINDGANTVITSFNFESKTVRTVLVNNEIYFVASDVCKILGLTNTTEAIKAIDEVDLSTLSNTEGAPPLNIFNESGLYTLILKSRKPEAKKFKRWITSEVLPSIRKTGSYSIAPKSPPELFDLSVKAMKELEEKNNLLQKEQENQHKDILKLTHNISRLENNAKYMTIIAYANLKNIKAKDYNPSLMGRKASKICLEKNILTGSIVDSRYGAIKTYPIDILESVFANNCSY